MESNSQYQENIISQLWAKYFPYWPLFIILIAFADGGAWFYLKHRLPVYESTATLLIKDEKKGIEDAKMMENFNQLSSKKIIENEIEVLRSRNLMNQVVNELHLYAPVYVDQKWNSPSAYTTSPVKIEARFPDSIVETERVDFTYDAKSSQVILKTGNYPLEEWVKTPWGELRFSANATGKVLENQPLFFALVHPKRVVKNLMMGLNVIAAGKMSSVITLKIKDENPRRSEDILNTLIAAYNQASLNDKNKLASNTLSFLDERLQHLTRDLDSIEKNLQQYRARKGAIDLSSQGKMFLQNVSENDQKLSDVTMKLAVLNQVENYITSNNSRGGLVPSTLGINDPLLTNLLNKLYEAELQYQKLKATTGENNPELLSLAEQIQKIKPSILENVKSQQRSLEANKVNLYSTNNTYNSLLSSLPQQERDLVEISRQQNIKSSIYSYLLQKREEAALSHSSTVSDSRVVDIAESSLDPAGISPKFIYGSALLLALFVGFTTITLREIFTNTILFRQEIESLTSYPVIGEISQQKSKTPLVINEGERSVVAEQFRMLRTTLPYLGIVGRGKKIMVTSTIAGEGKSFVASNLALSLAIAGKKVVLVEFDLCNPTLSERFNFQPVNGVADYLSGDVEPEEIIKRTGASQNLFLVPAGNLPGNPSELILSDRTKDILLYLEGLFDYVVIDTAPVGILSDGYVLSKLSDASLYVVRHRYTPKRMLQRLEQNNKIHELKNLALVFNGVKTRGFSKDYGYGYGYGYLYGQGNKPLKKILSK